MRIIESLGLGTNINFLMVFIEGVVSFFSPCVLPLIPLYMGYLAGGASIEDGTESEKKKRRKTIFIHTMFFVLGISVAFFLLGLGFSSIGSLIRSKGDLFAKISGLIIIVLGLKQMGLLKIKFLERNVSLNKKVNTKNMNPIAAFIMGFGFSFAWTPCVGPALASVLLLASNSKSVLEGNLYVLLYSVGFLIPFLILGLFTGEALNFLKRKQNIMGKIVKIGGAILVIMGLLLFSGTFGKFESLFNPSGSTSSQKTEESSNKTSTESKEEKKEENKPQKMTTIELKDQNGNLINIEKDFKGKVVFLNFFATWCPPCIEEMPDIQKLYEDNGFNKKDVVIIGVAGPGIGREVDEAGVKKFLTEHKIEYPVLMDHSGKIFEDYRVYSLPTTYMIDKDSYVYGYITGGMNRDVMDSAIKETLEKK